MRFPQQSFNQAETRFVDKILSMELHVFQRDINLLNKLHGNIGLNQG